MSLGIVIKSPSGLVLAADSRVTLTATDTRTGERFPVNYDNATKLLHFSSPNTHVAAVTYGQALIPHDERTAASYVPEFESTLPPERLNAADFAKRFARFMGEQWSKHAPDYDGPPMVFLLGGFDPEDPYGRVFEFRVPGEPEPTEHHGDGFGARWGGQVDIASRLVNGFRDSLPPRIAEALSLDADQRDRLDKEFEAEATVLPFGLLPLQDCVDLAVLLMRTTIGMQRLAVTHRGVGGPIDVVTITRTEGVKLVRFKEVTVDD